MEGEFRDAMKAALWEEAKGKLRALVAVQGSYSTAGGDWRTERWEQAKAAVEKFIKDFQDEGLSE